MGRLALVLLIGAVIAMGCATSKGDPAPGADRVVVEARVVAYLPDNVHYSYENQPDEWADTTQLELLAPPHLAGRKLYVNHQPDAPKASPWRAAGTILRLDLPKSAVEPPPGTSMDLFAAGVRVLGTKGTR